MKDGEITFPVFSDDKGNRFIFPSICDDGEKSIDFYQCMTLRLAIGVKEEPERLVVDVIDGSLQLRHIRTEILHPGFAHGAATVLLLSGPSFDEMASEPEAA